MLDKDTLAAVLDQIDRLRQEHPDLNSTVIAWTISQMLDKSVDRWEDGFRAGLSAGRA